MRWSTFFCQKMPAGSLSPVSMWFCHCVHSQVVSVCLKGHRLLWASTLPSIPCDQESDLLGLRYPQINSPFVAVPTMSVCAPVAPIKRTETLETIAI